jgi:NADPH:quinone reductase-like Zn-dependent oxidoreductase
MTSSEIITDGLSKIVDLHLAGRLTVELHPQTFRLEDARLAHDLLEDRRALGKVLLEID